MTSNRMEAKPIAGEHCRFCGDAKAPLVKTPCCDQWICCDTAFFSFRGGGRCQVEHERFSMCYSHYEDKHSGPWESCQKCREFWSPRDDQMYAENRSRSQKILARLAIYRVTSPHGYATSFTIRDLGSHTA